MRLVGTFGVNRDGSVLPHVEVGSRKARLLLTLLAVERGRLVPAGRVAEVLWGDDPPRRPDENMATLVSRLRSRLGRHIVEGGRSGYRLGDTVSVDLHLAAGLAGVAERSLVRRDSEAARGAAQQVLAMLERAGVLDDEPGALWAEPARTLQTESLRRARHVAAEAALRDGEPVMARPPAEAALRADPMDEIACRLLMRTYTALGEPGRALATYEGLRAMLTEEFGVDPSHATRDLHLAILQERVLTPSSGW
ncbi:AfsR/SARP family transcriptional regulator [Sphaerisporangium corydalis]|uniref:BTAD domain-containing putative transcriptional regulator n=1 Tax=Sphaerisporangium corydalis TaxID=1441875 RepID=A0ABV9EVM9_9ACTN|nr:BTAD domain-containing putative transcriptional regulator [Sphaerisporangium corydalis]